MRSFVQIILAILLVGIGGAGGWYLRGLGEFSRAADSAAHSAHDSANKPTQSALTGKPYDHQTLDRLLSTAQYEEAIEWFRTLVFDKGFKPVGWASELFFFHTKRLERLGATHKAIRLLQEYLAVASQDADAYILLAHLQHRKGSTGAALETLVSASITVRSERQAQLLREFDRMLRAYVSQHRDNESDAVDEALLERLVQALPHHEPLYLELARRYIQIGDLGVAAAWLKEVDPNGKQAVQRERLRVYIERQLEQVAGFESRVSLQRLGRHYTVDVTIINGYDEVDFRLMIDTGASLTLLTPEAAERLDIVVDAIERHQRLATPGGLVDAPLYQIEALVVGQEVVWDLPIAIVPLGIGGGLIDGLIGMDFLGKFDFKIDQDKQELKLTPRP
ncbi:MAG: aspartyl protease family protein [bacterium]|nr:aspartyl protease family protein [bacterium]